jgi:hypothetical protein
LASNFLPPTLDEEDDGAGEVFDVNNTENEVGFADFLKESVVEDFHNLKERVSIFKTESVENLGGGEDGGPMAESQDITFLGFVKKTILFQ